MTYRMTFRGTSVPAEPGQSVAAALVAAGITDWRTTRKRGRPRGLFCGIGVCFDCLITIDGAPGLRACLVPAADGMRLGDDPAPDTGDADGCGEGDGDRDGSGDGDGDGDQDGDETGTGTVTGERAARGGEEEDGDAAHV